MLFTDIVKFKKGKDLRITIKCGNCGVKVELVSLLMGSFAFSITCAKNFKRQF